MALLDARPQRDSGQPRPAHRPRRRTGLARAGRWLAGSNAGAASFARFVAVGGSANVVYVAAFWLLSGSGTQLANAVGFLASTAFANELHRRLTFHARGNVRWYTAQLEGGGLALTGLAVTSLSLAWADQLAGEPSTGFQAALVIVVTALVGLVRFVALRTWFRPAQTIGPRA